MYTCPYCGEPALSWKKKLWLGPSINVKCQSCRKEVSISWKTMWMSPVIVVYFILTLIIEVNFPIVLLGWVLIALMTTVIQLKFIPMVKRDISE